MAKTRRRWSQASVVEALQRFHAETGDWPLSIELDDADNDLPCYQTVEWHCGTLTDAVRLAARQGGDGGGVEPGAAPRRDAHD